MSESLLRWLIHCDVCPDKFWFVTGVYAGTIMTHAGWLLWLVNRSRKVSGVSRFDLYFVLAGGLYAGTFSLMCGWGYPMGFWAWFAVGVLATYLGLRLAKHYFDDRRMVDGYKERIEEVKKRNGSAD